MPRAIWSGPISFGLVNIPVSLYPATKSRSVSFRQLHAEDNTPINYAKVCPADEKILASEEIVRGYEFKKGRFVVMEDKDFEAVTMRKGRAIEIINFINLAEIDPIYYQKSYYLVLQDTSLNAFRLLVEAMMRQNKAALARLHALMLPLETDLPPLASGSQTVSLEGRELRLTNLDKRFWPDDGYAKSDLVNYYFRVSQFILPHLAGRPLSLKRHPDGAAGGFFFQKNAAPDTNRAAASPRHRPER